MDKTTIMKNFISSSNNGFYSNKFSIEDIEKLIDEIITKLESNQKLENVELKFLNTYMNYYYLKILDEYTNLFPDYDKFLKPIHQKIVQYYITHINDINYESTVFLQFFFLNEMNKEFKINAKIEIGTHNKYFDNEPNVQAYHTRTTIAGRSTPLIVYNPKSIEEIANNKNIFELLNYGFHELRHEFQQMQIESENLENPQALIWAKEELVRKYILGDIFYETNYLDIFLERDARDYAKQRTIETAKKFNIGEINLSNTIASDSPYDASINFLDPRNNEQKLAIYLIDDTSTNYIKEHPNVLNMYPVLKNLYNTDGTKKSLTQIEQEIEIEKKKQIKLKPEQAKELEIKYSKLILEIIKTDPELIIEYLCQNINTLSLSGKDITKKKNELNKIIKSIKVSYDEIIRKINIRIHHIEKTIANSSTNLSNLYKELNNTRILKKCILKYVDEFKEKHEHNTKILIYKQELKNKFKINIDKYKWLSDKGGIKLIDKNLDELELDFLAHRRVIRKSNLDEESKNDYLKKLKYIYDSYIKEYQNNLNKKNTNHNQEINSMFDNQSDNNNNNNRTKL